MREVAVVGLDLAKNVLQVGGIDTAGVAVMRKRLRRNQVFPLSRACRLVCSVLKPARRPVTGGRWLMAIGHEVRLMPPAYVKAYLKRGKTDAADAEALAEAVTRPTMRFVVVKSEARQAVLMLRKARDLLFRQRTMLINALRGHLSKFGIAAASTAAATGRTHDCARPSAERPLHPCVLEVGHT